MCADGPLSGCTPTSATHTPPYTRSCPCARGTDTRRRGEGKRARARGGRRGRGRGRGALSTPRRTARRQRAAMHRAPRRGGWAQGVARGRGRASHPRPAEELETPARGVPATHVRSDARTAAGRDVTGRSLSQAHTRTRTRTRARGAGVPPDARAHPCGLRRARGTGRVCVCAQCAMGALREIERIEAVEGNERNLHAPARGWDGLRPAGLPRPYMVASRAHAVRVWARPSRAPRERRVPPSPARARSNGRDSVRGELRRTVGGGRRGPGHASGGSTHIVPREERVMAPNDRALIPVVVAHLTRVIPQHDHARAGYHPRLAGPAGAGGRRRVRSPCGGAGTRAQARTARHAEGHGTQGHARARRTGGERGRASARRLFLGTWEARLRFVQRGDGAVRETGRRTRRLAPAGLGAHEGRRAGLSQLLKTAPTSLSWRYSLYFTRPRRCCSQRLPPPPRPTPRALLSPAPYLPRASARTCDTRGTSHTVRKCAKGAGCGRRNVGTCRGLAQLVPAASWSLDFQAIRI